MNDKAKNGIVVVLAIGAVIVSLLAFSKPATEKVVERTVVEKPTLGALAGPDIPYGWFSFGGVRRFATRGTLNQASTTLCSIQSPAATSTLVSAPLTITTGTTTAIGVEIGKSTTNLTATTTRLAFVTLGADAQLTLDGAKTASTTGSYGAKTVQRSADENDLVFEPLAWLVFKYGGVKGTTNVLVGTCAGVFEQVSGY